MIRKSSLQFANHIKSTSVKQKIVMIWSRMKCMEDKVIITLCEVQSLVCWASIMNFLSFFLFPFFFSNKTISSINSFTHSLKRGELNCFDYEFTKKLKEVRKVESKSSKDWEERKLRGWITAATVVKNPGSRYQIRATREGEKDVERVRELLHQILHLLFLFSSLSFSFFHTLPLSLSLSLTSSHPGCNCLTTFVVYWTWNQIKRWEEEDSISETGKKIVYQKHGRR